MMAHGLPADNFTCAGATAERYAFAKSSGEDGDSGSPAIPSSNRRVRSGSAPLKPRLMITGFKPHTSVEPAHPLRKAAAAPTMAASISPPLRSPIYPLLRAAVTSAKAPSASRQSVEGSGMEVAKPPIRLAYSAATGFAPRAAGGVTVMAPLAAL